MFRAFKAKVL